MDNLRMLDLAILKEAFNPAQAAMECDLGKRFLVTKADAKSQVLICRQVLELQNIPILSTLRNHHVGLCDLQSFCFKSPMTIPSDWPVVAGF